MTDSNSGIGKAEAEKLGVFVLPMPVIIDGKIYYEGVDLDQKTFYESLTGGRDVSTSQPSPGDVMELWDRVLSAGYDELVYIPMSSGLSSSCATAVSLAADYNGKVEVADNHRISVTMHVSVLEAVSMAKAGMPAREIRESLERRAYDSSIYIAVDDLKYLKKGGRITPAAAALGMVLSVKPVLSIQGGKLDAFAKTRGMKKAKEIMLKALKEDLDTRFAGTDPARIRIGAAGAGLTGEQEQQWREMLAQTFPQFEVYYDPLSFSVGSHTGPNAYGMGLSVMPE